MSPRLADWAGEVVRRSAVAKADRVARKGQAGGRVDRVVAGLLERLRSGMRATLSRGPTGGASRGWRGGEMMGLMLAAERAVEQGLSTGRRSAGSMSVGAGRGWDGHNMSPRRADGVVKVVRKNAGVWGRDGIEVG